MLKPFLKCEIKGRDDRSEVRKNPGNIPIISGKNNKRSQKTSLKKYLYVMNSEMRQRDDNNEAVLYLQLMVVIRLCPLTFTSTCDFIPACL